MQTPAASQGMPTWLKWVIGLAVLAVIGGIVVVAVVVSIGSKMFGTALDPKATEKIAHQIVVLEDPLPPDWKYTMNMDVMSLKMVSIMNMQNKTMINFMQLPNPKHQTASEMINDPNLEKRKYSGTARFDVEDRGEETIGGEKVPVLRGKMRDGKEMEMGFVVLPSGKAVMIQIIEPVDKYDPTLVKPLLDKVKGYVAG